ncbi:hypothetical protein SBV1_2670011 [Verrucomicrobia bacterium]|nr:hypothetical protein SBV1_2670011 [Verrucomicrobiota bacterium]
MAEIVRHLEFCPSTWIEQILEAKGDKMCLDFLVDEFSAGVNLTSRHASEAHNLPLQASFKWIISGR